MSDFSIKELKTEEKDQFEEAIHKTVGTRDKRGKIETYPYLRSTLEGYDQALLPKRQSLSKIIESKLENGSNVSLLVIGQGSGQMARDLMKRLGEASSKVSIDEIGAGDPRTPQEKFQDIQYGINFTQGDITSVPLPDNKYDLVVSKMTLLHLVDPLRILKKLYRATKIGGELITDFSFYDLASRIHSNDINKTEAELKSYIARYLNPQGIHLALGEKGFRVVKTNEPLKFPHLRYTRNLFTGLVKYII